MLTVEIPLARSSTPSDEESSRRLYTRIKRQSRLHVISNVAVTTIVPDWSSRVMVKVRCPSGVGVVILTIVSRYVEGMAVVIADLGS